MFTINSVAHTNRDRKHCAFGPCWCDGVEGAVSRILYLRGFSTTQAAIIYLGCRLPDTSCDQPEGLQTSSLQVRLHCRCTTPSIWSCSGWGLPSQTVSRLLVSSYLTISPLPGIAFSVCHYSGRYVSVALSLRSLPLAVSQHPALWSSDFPRTLRSAIACLPQIHLRECNISLSKRLAPTWIANPRQLQRGSGCSRGRAPQGTPVPSWGRGSSYARLHARARPSCATGSCPARA